MTNIDQLTSDIYAHVEREWPTAPGRLKIDAVLVKLTEELGELNGGITKHLQQRVDKDWLDEARQEFGDVCIVLAQVAEWLHAETVASGAHPEVVKRSTFCGMFLARWANVKRRRDASYRDLMADLQHSVASRRRTLTPVDPDDVLPSEVEVFGVPVSRLGDATGPGHA